MGFDFGSMIGGISNGLLGFGAQLFNTLTNKKIADQNLSYQEDYNEKQFFRADEENAYNRAFAEDERAYNRAFAEDERAYNRALQQEIFNREDTAITRQAEQLSKLGINPLSQAMNGLNSGSVVSNPTAPSTVAPSTSTRSGNPLNNSFQSNISAPDFISPMLGLADTINGIETGEYTRDSLALENDRKFLENLKMANSLGINYLGLFPNNTNGYRKSAKEGNPQYFVTPEGTNLLDTPQFKKSLYSSYDKAFKDSNPDWVGSIDALGKDSIYDSVTRALTKMSGIYDTAFNKLFSKEKSESLYNLGKNKDGYFNPFNMFMNLMK